jgi:hypothetical protein
VALGGGDGGRRPLVLLRAGGLAAWQAFGGHGGGPTSGAGPASAAADGVPAGFVACGTMLCPAKPLCWAGTTTTGGRAASPRDLDCAQEHVWETFVAAGLPPDVPRNREDALLQRQDFAAACSAQVMATRSRDRADTAGWLVDAWPIEVSGTDLRLVHCLARPDDGAATGSAFRSESE